MVRNPKEFADILTELSVYAPNASVGDTITVQEMYQGRVCREAKYIVVSTSKGEASLELDSLKHNIKFNKYKTVEFEGDVDELADIFMFEIEDYVEEHVYLMVHVGKSVIPYEVLECSRIPMAENDVVEEEKYLVTAHTWRPPDMGWEEYLKEMEV